MADVEKEAINNSSKEKLSKMCQSVENFELILQETCIEHADAASMKEEFLKKIEFQRRRVVIDGGGFTTPKEKVKST
uniref:Uncharacterized protein n=1 Tax=Rhabditophanes sp. KR3021 TaxID=114890 RepID=A0AC35TIB0_9BILA